jgi:copper chaperone CopZ
MWFQYACTAALLAMLGWGMLGPLLRRRTACEDGCCSSTDSASRQVRLRITGMTCQGCARNVHRTLLGCAGVKSAAIDLAAATATLDGSDLDLPAVREALKNEGYEVTDDDSDGPAPTDGPAR